MRWRASRSPATGRGCAPASIGGGRGGWAATTWASMSTSRLVWPTRPRRDQVVLSDTALAQVELDGLKTARAKRLKAPGAPRDLHYTVVSRA